MRRSFFLCLSGLCRFFAVLQSSVASRVKLQNIIAAALLSASAVPCLSAPQASQSQVFKGHVPKITKKLSPQGRLDGNQHIDLAIGLPLRNREQLTNLLEDIYNPSSPNFRHFLK